MLRQQATEMLEQQIIPFWLALRNKEHGGFYGYMGNDLVVNPKAEKGCILNSRILWFFSQCAKELHNEDCRRAADHAYRFLRDRFVDREFGGVYWSVDYQGQPLDDSKHTYNQAFAVYGLSAYYEATGDAGALDLARSLFQVIDLRCQDSGGYLEALDRQFRPVSNEKLSENGVMAERTMNTLLHVFEGCSALYHAAPDPTVERAMRKILRIYQEKVYNPDLHRQEVFFNRNYDSLIDLHSYGHDIESSWLIDWGCDLLGDTELSAQIHAIDSALARNIYETAYSGHSVANECEKGVVDTTRIWWVQAEAVLGFVNQWEKHRSDIEFLTAAEDVFQYIQAVQTDRRSGEWFWAVDEKGCPDSAQPMVSPWKCPYHNGRMCLELIRRDPHA